MPSLKQLRELKVAHTVDFHGLPIQVTYRMEAMTDERIDQIRTAAGDADENTLDMLLGEIVVEWDITDDDGIAVALNDHEALRSQIPLPAKSAVLIETMRHATAVGNSTSR